MFGFLNIYKPKGKTSHDVVAILRRITNVKQIGHTGTLDPFAEGVLPVCIGKATRLIEYLDDDKAYLGTIQLGSSTTTYDIEGEEIHSSDKTVTEKEIEEVLKKFRGNIEQIPPIYSAIKVKGKKLYEYARKGENVQIKPRVVNIKELTVKNYNPAYRQLEIYVECSKGTYIRSLANDIGEKLETYGHLIKLVRVKAGRFYINDSIELDKLETSAMVENNLTYPLVYLNYPKYRLSPDEYTLVSHGMEIKPNQKFDNGIVLLVNQNSLAAVGKYNNGSIKPEKVF